MDLPSFGNFNGLSRIVFNLEVWDSGFFSPPFFFNSPKRYFTVSIKTVLSVVGLTVPNSSSSFKHILTSFVGLFRRVPVKFVELFCKLNNELFELPKEEALLKLFWLCPTKLVFFGDSVELFWTVLFDLFSCPCSLPVQDLSRKILRWPGRTFNRSKLCKKAGPFYRNENLFSIKRYSFLKFVVKLTPCSWSFSPSCSTPFSGPTFPACRSSCLVTNEGWSRPGPGSNPPRCNRPE